MIFIISRRTSQTMVALNSYWVPLYYLGYCPPYRKWHLSVASCSTYWEFGRIAPQMLVIFIYQSTIFQWYVACYAPNWIYYNSYVLIHSPTLGRFGQYPAHLYIDHNSFSLTTMWCQAVFWLLTVFWPALDFFIWYEWGASPPCLHVLILQGTCTCQVFCARGTEGKNTTYSCTLSAQDQAQSATAGSPIWYRFWLQ